MIGLTRKNGITVSLDAAYDIENETAEYCVTCRGARLCFPAFKDAAILYKSLCEEIETGCEMDERLATLEVRYGKKGVA